MVDTGFAEQLETLVQGADTARSSNGSSSSKPVEPPKPFHAQIPAPQNKQTPLAPQILDPTLAIPANCDWQFGDSSPQTVPQAMPQMANVDNFNFNAMSMDNVDSNFTWEMIGLGLEEPLPPQETVDELHNIYFDKVHPSMPMIHKYRYLAAMNLCV